MKDEKQINYLDVKFFDFEKKVSSSGKNYLIIRVIYQKKIISVFSVDCALEDDLKILSQFDNIKLSYVLSVYNDLVRIVPVGVQLIS